MTKKYVVGVTAGAPIPGSKILSADYLGNCVVNYIFVNNTIFDDLGDDPQFIHNIGSSTVSTPNYQYQYGDKLILSYTNFCPIQNECTQP